MAGPINAATELGVDGEVVADIGETHRRTAAQDRVDGGREGERGGDHLLPGADLQNCKGRVERDRPIGHRNGVRGPGHGRAQRFEPRDHRSLGKVAAAQDGEDEVLDLRAELRGRDPDARLWRRLSHGHDAVTSPAWRIGRCSSASRRRRAMSPVAMAIESRRGETVDRPEAM